jgi:uncharacterized protein YecE (DUF72 family)
MGTLIVGTSGFSYDDWVGRVYPPDTPKTKMLEHYPARLRGLEINYTYYRMPTARTMESLAARAGGRLRFAVKLTDLFTHKRTATEDDVAAFREAMIPLDEGGTLGCLLAQFPYAFGASKGNLRYLQAVLDAFRPLPVVVELRNARWLHPGLLSFLRAQGAGFCNVDEPALEGLLPPTAHATSRVGYVRFHGRNAATWWDHAEGWQRYDYLYSKPEIEEWVPRIRQLQEETETLFVFYNNHFRGKSVENAIDLLDLLEDTGP